MSNGILVTRGTTTFKICTHSVYRSQSMKDLLVLYRKAAHEKSTYPLSKGIARKIYLSFIERQGTKNLLVLYRKAEHEKSTSVLSNGRA